MAPYICRVAICHRSTQAEKQRTRGALRATHPTLSPHRGRADAVDTSSPRFVEAISGSPDAPHPHGITRVGNTNAITSVRPNSVEAVLPTHATSLSALQTILFSLGSGAQEEHPRPRTRSSSSLGPGHSEAHPANGLVSGFSR